MSEMVPGPGTFAGIFGQSKKVMSVPGEPTASA